MSTSGVEYMVSALPFMMVVLALPHYLLLARGSLGSGTPGPALRMLPSSTKEST
jgi:hypothetical protein